ncbi:hypothetical protein HDU93_001486 [Gonapodya sp. JEL0774]|nr:hypothetical protein HDU93_001486 [Gonapodya sp. JEL0774]
MNESEITSIFVTHNEGPCREPRLIEEATNQLHLKQLCMSLSAADSEAAVDGLSETRSHNLLSRKRSISADSPLRAPSDTSAELSRSLRPSKAPKTAATTLTLNCLLLGERSPFEVFTTLSASVNTLKKAVKDTRPHAFSDVDAEDLDLWKVNVPYTERGTLREEAFREEDVMEPLEEISYYFQPPVPKKYIHFVVRRRAGLLTWILCSRLRWYD